MVLEQELFRDELPIRVDVYTRRKYACCCKIVHCDHPIRVIDVIELFSVSCLIVSKMSSMLSDRQEMRRTCVVYRSST